MKKLLKLIPIVSLLFISHFAYSAEENFESSRIGCSEVEVGNVQRGQINDLLTFMYKGEERNIAIKKREDNDIITLAYKLKKNGSLAYSELLFRSSETIEVNLYDTTNTVYDHKFIEIKSADGSSEYHHINKYNLLYDKNFEFSEDIEYTKTTILSSSYEECF